MNHRATIEHLTRERDAALRRVERLERAIRDPWEVATAVTPEAWARYLTARGWTPATPPFWTHPKHAPVYLSSSDPLPVLRQLPDPLTITLADLLECADGPW